MNKEFMKTVWVVLTRYYMGKTIIRGPLNETEESIHNQVLSGCCLLHRSIWISEFQVLICIDVVTG